LSLADHGVGVRIVDEEFRTAAHSYALALHPRSLHVLEDLGVIDEVLARGYRVETVAFYEGTQRRGQMSLSELAGQFPFVLVLPQSELERLLEERLKTRGVKVEWNHQVRGLDVHAASVTATIDKLARASCGYAVATTEWVTQKTLRAEASFVVGADGHRSIVRRTIGADWVPAGRPESYAVFEFHTDADLQGEVRIVFDGPTTSVLWPLPGGRCRWSFQRPDPDATDESRTKRRLTVPIGRQVFPHVPEQELPELIRARAPWFEGDIQRIDWSMAVRFDRRLSSTYGRDRLWLAGDAAHLTGPVGGQSLNMGVREASALAVGIKRVLRGEVPAASLVAYGEAHSAEWRRLLGVDVTLGATDGTEPWARQRCSDILSCIPATGEQLISLASQIGLVATPAAR
jgi:2-polyprenyl-6-methoxyphenol hydroxylase-like FAD-dependent oxidoreductase